MKTTVKVTLKIVINHPNSPLDENSIKGLLNTGMATIADGAPETLSTISDEMIEGISVEPTHLQINQGVHNIQVFTKRCLNFFGTNDVPWGRA